MKRRVLIRLIMTLLTVVCQWRYRIGSRPIRLGQHLLSAHWICIDTDRETVSRGKRAGALTADVNRWLDVEALAGSAALRAARPPSGDRWLAVGTRDR